MPRRKKLDPESIRLWARSLPPWKKRVLKILLEAQAPMTTGEITEAIGYEATLSAVHHFLRRLERAGLVSGLTVFLSRKRAWRVREEYRQVLAQALREGTPSPAT